MHNKICEGCNSKFTTNRKRIRFCSKMCANKNVKKHHKRKVRNCTICGKEFFSKRKRKTCSEKCLKEKFCETGHLTKLSETKIRHMIQLRKKGVKIKDIAVMMNINKHYASSVLSGKVLPEVNREIIKDRLDKLSNLPTLLTDIQKSVIEGSLLGDGYIEKAKFGNCRFGKVQKLASLEYVQYVYDVMKPYSTSLSERVRENKIRNNSLNKFLKSVTIRTVNHPIFTGLRNKWYPNDIKVVPEDICLTPLALAIWFCDDGSNHKNKKEAIIHTQSFTENEIEMLIEKLLKSYNIKCKINYDGIKLPTIRIGAQSYEDFINIIKPHVLFECMKYKTIIYDYNGVKTPSC